MTINTLDEYDKLAQMADVAEESLTSGSYGSHYALRQELRKHGITTYRGREDDIKSARKLCQEFLTAYNAP